MLLPMAIRTATDADPISRTYLAFIICLAGVNLYYSRTAFNAFIETIQLRFENSVLISRLEKERDKALAANRSKSRFLAAASHDLRQPIHALGLFIATLGAWSRRSDVDSEAAHTLSQRMQTVVINLSGLLDSLLDISRLDARVVKPVIGPVALSRFFNDLHEEFSGIAREKGIRFGIVQTSAWVETDPILLKRILGNLLSNALKFTNCGGVILGCRHRCGRVIVQIADTGTGIPKDQLTSVFDEFYQLDNEARDREKGLGLGLSIVKRTADLLKHDIKIRSIPNRGTIVSIALPLSAAIMPVHSHVSTPVTSGLSIVLLDDDRAVIEAMTQLLSSWGHRVIAGRNLDDLFNKIPTANSSNEAEVDFIIADYRLGSSLEGPEAIDRIRRRLNRNVPALLVTGDTSPEQLLDASRTGFRVLYKPVHPDELKDSLYS
ncbi:MAG: ATP-binding protein [Phyllobacterium sp.]